MTSLSSSADRPKREIIQRFEHNANAVAYTFLCACTLVGVVMDFDKALAKLLTYPYAGCAAIGITCLSIANRHAHTLCGRCLGKMPVDGSQQADNKRKWLWLSHHQPWVLGWFIGLLVVSVFVSGTANDVIATIMLVPLLANLAAIRIHWRLEPWCPWCRDDGGDGDDIHENVPDPQGSHTPDSQLTR